MMLQIQNISIENWFKIEFGVFMIEGLTAEEYFSKGQQCIQLLNPERSIPYFKKAIELDPNNPQYHARMGSALFATHRVSEAITYYEKAVELDPNNMQNPLESNARIERNIYNSVVVDSPTTEVSTEEDPLLGKDTSDTAMDDL